MRHSIRPLLLLSLAAGCASSPTEPDDPVAGGWGGTGGQYDDDDDGSDASSSPDDEPAEGYGGSGTTTPMDVGGGGACGDGVLDPEEDCDDGNTEDRDGCAADCVFEPSATAVVAGGASTCAILPSGNEAKCWGRGAQGRLGYGMTEDVGDDELPADLDPLAFDVPLRQIAVGSQHTCAVREDLSVVCWGYAANGRLGLLTDEDVGDDELPNDYGTVDTGTAVVAVAAGGSHTCAITKRGEVLCWGHGAEGRLGYGKVEDIGDDEHPREAGPVPLGGAASQVALGLSHACALLDTGDVRCWGRGRHGVLGQAGTEDVGDDEVPVDLPPVHLDARAVQISAGNTHTCAVLATGQVQCWGRGDSGQLGYGSTENIGDDEEPADRGCVELGAAAIGVAAGGTHTCALLEDGSVVCWGSGELGQLGYGDTHSKGDDELPFGKLELGGSAVRLSAGSDHTCALIEGGRVACWGFGNDGRLGYGNIDNVGDDESPAEVGTVLID